MNEECSLVGRDVMYMSRAFIVKGTLLLRGKQNCIVKGSLCGTNQDADGVVDD